jgi:putative transposase
VADGSNRFLGIGSMREPFTQLYVHLVWSTWDRLPMLQPGLKPRIYACIRREADRLRCEILAIGGIEDHVHVLVRIPPTIAIADLVKRLKGVSSHLANREMMDRAVFKWQGGYGAFTVSKRALPRAQHYILNQEEHHRAGILFPALEP